MAVWEVFFHLLISGSSDLMSSENRYGGLLTKVETGLQRLSNLSESNRKKRKEIKTFALSVAFKHSTGKVQLHAKVKKCTALF